MRHVLKRLADRPAFCKGKNPRWTRCGVQAWAIPVSGLARKPARARRAAVVCGPGAAQANAPVRASARRVFAAFAPSNKALAAAGRRVGRQIAQSARMRLGPIILLLVGALAGCATRRPAMPLALAGAPGPVQVTKVSPAFPARANASGPGVPAGRDLALFRPLSSHVAVSLGAGVDTNRGSNDLRLGLAFQYRF
jgi:hypothetical protein